MGGRIRLAVAKAATRARAARVSWCGDGDAEGPLTRDKVQFLRWPRETGNKGNHPETDP